MSIINAQTHITGLIGNDISRSKSFQLHNYTLQKHNINAVYVPFSVQNLSSVRQLFSLDNFLGANVTIPYKEKILVDMDVLTETAKQIQSVNTIHKKNGQLIGDNTDYIGFIESTKQYNIPWTQYPIYLLGAGGSAKSICYALTLLGVEHIFCWNRNQNNISSLQNTIHVSYWDTNSIPKHAIIIQTTPLGTHNEHPLPHIQWCSTHILIDILYKKTPLYLSIQQAGGLAIEGTGMLIHQAAHSFARWFSCAPPVETMYESLVISTQ